MIKKMKRGFTLVELMIVVAIIGVLAALAIYGVSRYLTNAKTAEARTAVGRIAKDASAAYSMERMAGAVLAQGGSVQATNQLCVSAAATVPANVIPAGAKYQSNPAEWDDNAGWECLKFSINDPQYFQYNYTSANNNTFQAIAVGDLDGDANNTPGAATSQFSLTGNVVNGVVNVAPAITEVNPEE